MTSFPLVIVKRAQDSVNVGKSLHPLTVMTAVLVIMDIQIVDHVNVTLMVLVALFVNLLEDLALVSKTIKESFARNVKRDIIISQNVCVCVIYNKYKRVSLFKCVFILFKIHIILSSACECNPEGSSSEKCDAESGQCSCKNNYGGRTCDECQDGYSNYPECRCMYYPAI